MDIKNYQLNVRRINISEAGAPYGDFINHPGDVARVAKDLIGNSAQEIFLVFHLNIKNEIIGYTEVARGSINMCPVDMREVFRTAIVLGAVSIIVSHCHPSGDPNPSIEDIKMTKRIKESSVLLNIELLDHVIVSDSGSMSFVERGLM